MKTRHGMGIGLVGLLLSTVGFAAAPAPAEVTEEITVAAVSPEDQIMDEIVVTARRPRVTPTFEALALYRPLELLNDVPIEAPELSDELPFKPEIKLDL